MRHTGNLQIKTPVYFFRSATRCDVCDGFFETSSPTVCIQCYLKNRLCLDEATAPLIPLTVYDMNSQSQMSGAGLDQSQIPTTPRLTTFSFVTSITTASATTYLSITAITTFTTTTIPRHCDIRHYSQSSFEECESSHWCDGSEADVCNTDEQ